MKAKKLFISTMVIVLLIFNSMIVVGATQLAKTTKIQLVVPNQIFVGDTLQAKITVTPSSTKPVITYTTSNKLIATIDKTGMIKALKPGTVTFRAAYGKLVSSISVKVVPKVLSVPTSNLSIKSDIIPEVKEIPSHSEANVTEQITEKKLSYELIDDSQLSLSYRLGDNVKAGYNFNLELLFIAAAHSEDFNHKGYVVDKSHINELTVQYFRNFPKKDSASVLYLGLKDSVINKFSNRTVGDILSYKKNLGTALYSADNNNNLKSALEDFNNYTKADEFFINNQKEYKRIIDEFLNQFKVNHISAIEDILGIKPKNASFNIVFSPTMAGGQALSLRDNQGNPVYFNITNPTRPISSSLMVLYHEDIHNFLEDIFKKDLSKYSNSNFTKVLKSNIGGSNAFNETITRALTNIVLEKYHKDIDTNKIMNQELANGWINTDRVYELLQKEYLPNREKYKSIEDFMPRILEYLKELEKEPVAAYYEQKKYDVQFNKDTKLYLWGSKEFCEGMQVKLPFWKVEKGASINYFENSLLGNPNSVNVISASYNYSQLPVKIKELIKEDAYNSIKLEEFVTVKAGSSYVVIVR